MKQLWQEDNEYEKLEPLTDEMVEKAEQLLNVTLPDSYIRLLKEQNGGYINLNAHPSKVATSWAEDHVNVDMIYGIGMGDEKGILNSSYLIQEWGLPIDIVLISGDGHTWIALDYRNTKEDPPVIFIDVDEEQVVELAPSFESFLTGLTVWEE